MNFRFFLLDHSNFWTLLHIFGGSFVHLYLLLQHAKHYLIGKSILQVYADDYVPREVDFMVVDQHPTLLNVTLHPSKVGQVPKGNHKAWKPPWLPSPRSSHKFVGSWWHAGERGDRLPSWGTNTDFGGGFNGSKTNLASSSGVAKSHVWAAFRLLFFTINIVIFMSFS